MAKTKLKQLEVNEVSLVDAGANQHADVKLYKNRDGKPGGEGQTQPGQEERPKSGLRRFFSAIGKALNIPDEDVESAADDIEKADTFNQKMDERKKRRIMDEIWDVCYALESSLGSIMKDDEVADKASLMNQSIDEFTATIKGMTASWGNGKPAQITKVDVPVEHMQESVTRLEDMIKTASGEPAANEPAGKDPETDEEKDGKEEKPVEKSEGGIPDMKFNEANMTAADKLAFEELKKRYAVDEPEDGAGAGQSGTEPVGKAAGEGQGAAPAANEPAPAPAAVESGEDIYKGLHPAVAAELKALRKRADEAEEKELLEVAKRYEIIGKKPEELAPVLKSLKAAGGTAYADMIGVLDNAVAMAEQSGAFSEIGKRGNGSTADAWSKIEKHASDIRKAEPNLSQAEAIDKACMMYPELVSEYEENR